MKEQHWELETKSKPQNFNNHLPKIYSYGRVVDPGVVNRFEVQYSSMAFSNTYHRRQVASQASKPCFVCYKPTTTVLNQEDSKDWFFTCPGHLSNRGFAIPVVDQEAEAAKHRKEELDREIEAIKKEYEEKMKKKKGKYKDKDKDKQEKTGDSKKEEEEMDGKVKALEAQKDVESQREEGPRIFNLHKSVFQMRVQRLRMAQQAKQTQERLRNPATFPAVPSGEP